MESVLITPGDKNELNLIKTLLEKMNISKKNYLILKRKIGLCLN
jgi:hypothetical protein